MTTSMKLPPGMTADEAVRRAAAWWDNLGRHEIARHKIDIQKEMDRVKAGGGVHAIKVRGAESQLLQSPILNGMPFDMLPAEDRQSVVMTWLEEKLLPELHGEKPPKPVKQIKTERRH